MVFRAERVFYLLALFAVVPDLINRILHSHPQSINGSRIYKYRNLGYEISNAIEGKAYASASVKDDT
jgi:hypothetical protein